jgi:hypothetical protein
VIYVSRWSSAEKAAEFAGIYARSLGKRYKKAEEIKGAVSRETASSEGASGEVPDEKPARKVELLLGRHSWNTDEGTVVIEEKGDTVFVSESLDGATTEMVEREVFGSGN